jgi:ATPase family AAA domain-containing protein 3A/B
MKHKHDMERVEAEALARARADRENKDINKEYMMAKMAERRTTTLETIKYVYMSSIC